MTGATAAEPHVVVIVPVGALDEAKSRLGGTLDAEERRELVIRLVARTVAAAVATPGVAETIVVTPDAAVRELALGAGARPILQRGRGLNQALDQARGEAIAAGATAVAIQPVDLPLVTPAAIEALLGPLADPIRPLVVIVPDRHGRGTNALVVAPPDAIEFAFGGDSRAAHAEDARTAGARLVVVEGPLALDLDTPDDLLLVEELLPEAIHAR